MSKNQNNIDVKTWLTNFTKSIAYSTAGMASSTLFPETSQHISSSMDMMKEARNKFKESAAGVSIQNKRLDSSAAGRTTVKLLKSIVEDVKSGDFSIPKKDDLFDDLGIDMEFDVTESENDDGSSSFDVNVSNDAKLTANAVIDGSLITTEAIANMSKRISHQGAKSTEALVRTMQTMATISTNAITKQMIESNERLEQIGDNIATIVNFLKESQASVNEATMKHYNAMEEALAMQLRIWGKYDKKKEKSYSQQLREGGFDTETFAKMVKKNFKNNSLVSSLSMMGTMGSMLTSFSDMGMGSAIRPMDMALQFAISSLIPKNTKAAIRNLDKNIPIQLNRQLSKLGDYKGKASWLGVLADLFGYDQSKYSKMDIGSYNKNAISWDGYSKKALEEVIPFYLSRIAASLDKDGIQYIYDYKSGNFKEKSAIISDYQDEIAGSIQMSFQPLLSRLDEMMKTSDGQYKAGWSSRSQEEARREFGSEISKYLKSQGTMKQEDFEKAITAVLQGDKYKYRLSDLQMRELRETASAAAVNFGSQVGDSDFIKKFSGSSDYAALRALIGSGDLIFDKDEYGNFDIFGQYLDDDIFNRKTSTFERYEKNRKKKEKNDERNRQLFDSLGNRTRKFVKDSTIGRILKGLKIRAAGGGSLDEKLSSTVNNATRILDSMGSVNPEDAISAFSTSGIKGVVNKVKDNMPDFNTDKNEVHRNTVEKALWNIGIDPSCYSFRWEKYAGQEWLYRGDLEVEDANNTKWAKFPRLILPNMFVNGKFDIKKAKENYYNFDMQEATDISTRKRELRERQEARKREREEYQNATIVSDSRNVSGNQTATPEVPKASDVQRTIGREETSPKGSSQGATTASSRKKYRVKRKNTNSSSAPSDDSNGQTYNSSASSSATERATAAVEGVVEQSISDGASKVASAMADVGDAIREQGSNTAKTMFEENSASQKAVEEAMQESGSKLSKVNLTFSEKLKGKLKIALGALIAGFVGKKIFSKKGLNILAAATAVGGPLGIALAGLGAGILASKIDFRRMFFGYENTNENGEIKKKKKKASLLDRIFYSFKSNVIDEFALGARGFIKEMGAYAKMQLAAPLKRLFNPISEGLKSVGSDIKDGVKKKLGALGSKIVGNVKRAASSKHLLSRTAIRIGAFGARQSAKGVLKGLGVTVQRAMYSRMKKDYQRVYGKDWKSKFNEGADLAQRYVDEIYRRAGENPTPDAIKAAKDSVFATFDMQDPEYVLIKANVEYMLEQIQNKENYKRVQQETRNQRYRMNKYHKAMSKSGNDINSMSTEDLTGILKELQKGGVFGNMKNDKTLQRLINEGNHDDMVKYLQSTATNPDLMAKIYDQRDQEAENAAKREAEEQEVKTNDKKYKNKILYFLSFMANRLSHGRVPVMDPDSTEETVGSKLASAEVNEEEASQEIAKANQATLETEERQHQEAAEKQAEIIADEEAKKRKNASENAEDDSVQSMGAQGTRKGGYERKNKHNIHDKDSEKSNDESNKEENKSIFANIGETLKNFLGIGGSGGGIFDTLKSGLSAIFGLMKNPAVIAGIAVIADIALNDGKGTKTVLKGIGNALNPFSKGSNQHETKIEAGNGVESDNLESYVINDDGSLSINNSGNPAGSIWRNMIYRGMSKAKGNTVGEQVVSTIYNTGGEFKKGIKIAGNAINTPARITGNIGDAVLHPIKTIRNLRAGGGFNPKNINVGDLNPKKVGLLGKAKNKAYTWMEAGIDKTSNKLQKFASKLGSKMGKVTGRVADVADDAVVDAALKQSDELIEKAASKATASPDTIKAGAKSLRSIWNKIKGVVDDVIKAFENSAGAKTFLSAIGLDKGIDKILSTVKKGFHKVADAVDDKILSKFRTKLTSVGTKMTTEAASDAVAFVPVVGQVLKGLEAAWNLVTGALEAANLFAVKEEDVDIYMRAISAAMKVFFNLFPIVWIVPLLDEIIIEFTGGKFSIQRLIAEGFYDGTLFILEKVSGSETAANMRKKLDESQAEFDKEFQEYNKRTGNNLTKEEYNDMQNSSVGDKISNWWNNDIHWWDNEKTKTAKQMRAAYLEKGINSQEYKDLASKYEEMTGKSALKYLGIDETNSPDVEENVGDGPAGYGFLSSVKNLFTGAKSEAQNEIQNIEHNSNSSGLMTSTSIKKGSLWSNLKQLGVNISKKMLETSPEWNTVVQLTQINSALSSIRSIITSQFKYNTKVDEAKLANDDSSGNGVGPVGFGFNQADPRWANMPTGKFANGQRATMKTAGCGFSALADVDRMFGGNSTPDKVARMAISRGDVADGGAKASLFEKGINGVHGTPVGDAKSMARSLRNGQPVIISGQAGYGPGVNVFPKTSKHLVVGRGMDANGNVIIENPMYGTQKVPFTQLASQTRGAWAMSKSAGYGPGDKNGEDYILYQQKDPAWAALPIGEGLTVGHHGCVNTSVAMATSMLNEKRIDPGMIAKNVFNPTSGPKGFSGETWTKLKNLYDIDSEEYGRNGRGDANEAIQKSIEAIKAGKPVSLHGDPEINAKFSWNNQLQPKTEDGSQHDILAYGMDADGNFLVLDPFDATNGSRGLQTAAHISPGSLINGLLWARIYSKDGKGIKKNTNFSANANMEGRPTGDTNSDESSSSVSQISDIFSKLSEGIKAITSNAMTAFFSGSEYKRAINSDGSVIGTSGDDTGSASSDSESNSIDSTTSYGSTSEEVANIVNNSVYSTFTPTNPKIGGPYSASFNPKYANRLNQDLGLFNGVTSDQLNQYIERQVEQVEPDSVFRNQGSNIIDASKQTGLDPRYILAHAAIETGWGDPENSGVMKNNYFGIGAYNNNESASNSFNGNGFIEGAKWIRDNYYIPGQKTLAEMLIGKKGHTYASYDVENYGRNTPNYHWANSIASTMDNMGFGPGATISGRVNPIGYKLDDSNDDTSDVLEERMDIVVDLLSQIANNTKQTAGQGFVNNSTSVGYGTMGNAKTQLNDIKKKQTSNDLRQRVKDKEETPRGDLGRSNLMAIHKVVASGYRSVTR